MCPVAVPEKIIGLTLFLDFFDRCHSLSSLHPPLAALASLPLPVYAALWAAKERIATPVCGLVSQ